MLIATNYTFKRLASKITGTGAVCGTRVLFVITSSQFYHQSIGVTLNY